VPEGPSGELNEPQQRRLITSFQQMDRLLDEIERSFEEARCDSPFRRYRADINAEVEILVRQGLGQLRLRLGQILGEQGLSARPALIDLRHSVRTTLTFLDIAVTEIEPHYMASYGRVAPAAAGVLNEITAELHGTVRQLLVELVKASQ
jgi:hypothetical protein